MTQEEAKQQLWSTGKINSLSKVECDAILNEVFSYFEAKIVQLESTKQLSCDGCKYHNTNAHLVCMHCNRDGEDLYSPEEPQ